MSTVAPRGRIIVFGFAFWFPLAGVSWQYLHYLSGLRRLGFDVWYVEDSNRWVYDPWTQHDSPDPAANVARVSRIFEAHGFAGRWAFRSRYQGGDTYGVTSRELDDLYASADAFLNVTGAQELYDEHLRIPLRIYVETDPVADQIKVAQGNQETITALDAHTHHFSFGENFGNADCGVPLDRYTWLPTRQPVETAAWATDSEPTGPFTTIATWSNKGKDISYNGETYHWSKDLEFQRFLDLPSRTSATLELATGEEPEVVDLLQAHGWATRSAVDVSTDSENYRRYIQEARGEFTVAKDQNIRLRSGWFSDRSACFLAAGRPVVTQDTAFGAVLPTGNGLFAFSTMDDILAALDAIESDYAGHSRAAAELAREYFEADRVLGSLVDRAGL